MSSFNIDGVPATANRWLLTRLLRGRSGDFQGMVVTDYGHQRDEGTTAWAICERMPSWRLKPEWIWTWWGGLPQALPELVAHGEIMSRRSTKPAGEFLRQCNWVCLRIVSRLHRGTGGHLTENRRPRRKSQQSFVLLKNDRAGLPEKIGIISRWWGTGGDQQNVLGSWRAAGGGNGRSASSRGSAMLPVLP